MKTIKEFQESKSICIEKETMDAINGGLLPEGSTRREDFCTGANDGDSEVTYYSDSGQLISIDGTRLDGSTYHYP
ncbi:hypothetical protein J7I94_37825 [Streptomyces sp. ISL-12]|nr:hypothetical protein [Streptomyces sp. ISL-12]